MKLALSLFPPSALAHAVHALQDGNARPGRGAYNWRHGVRVSALEYADKAQRHIDLWKAGEGTAPDSLVHHLGCAIADLAIALDAEAMGLLIDDRQRRRRPPAAVYRSGQGIGRRENRSIKPRRNGRNLTWGFS